MVLLASDGTGQHPVACALPTSLGEHLASFVDGSRDKAVILGRGRLPCAILLCAGCASRRQHYDDQKRQYPHGAPPASLFDTNVLGPASRWQVSSPGTAVAGSHRRNYYTTERC